ncbi:MAG: hypothetical protein J7L15_04290, partial [Clostridiales bacterium]|nr:hypothetical protein [Clostridiales bacterium]
TFSGQLSELSDFALAINGIKNEYNEDDLVNASLVFMEIFSSLMFDCHANKLDQTQMGTLFEEAGTTMHQTIKVFTGIDIKEVLKKNS